MYGFEKLDAWKKSLELIESVYQCIKQLPREEAYALSDQLRRSSTSIALNIAEGSGARTKKDFAVFTRHALKSLYETVANLKIIERIYQKNIEPQLLRCDEVGKLLHGLLKYLETKN